MEHGLMLSIQTIDVIIHIIIVVQLCILKRPLVPNDLNHIAINHAYLDYAQVNIKAIK